MNSIFAKIVPIGIATALALSIGALYGCTENQNTNNNNASIIEEDNSDIAADGKNFKITEQEVNNYISQYRSYIGCEDDAAWATLLDKSGQSAEEVRREAINEIAKKKMVEIKAEELGLSATDDEIDDFIENAKIEAGYSVDDNGWLALLQTTGYTEETYRDDARYKVLSTKVFGNEIKYNEADNPQMQSYANAHTDSYVGKTALAIVFPHANFSSASLYKKQIGDSANEETFKNFAQEAVDSGAATKILNLNWSCIINTTNAYDAAISELTPGSVALYEENDGSYVIVMVTQEYILPYNGRLVMKDMPDAIKSKLASDTSAYIHQIQETDYLNELIADVEINVYDMPANAPYNVDLNLSTYGTETSSSDIQNAQNEIANNQISALEAAAKSQ